MSTDITIPDREIAIAGFKDERLSQAIEAALATNDLSKLTTTDRVLWYNHRCKVAGFDPSTRPFRYILTKEGRLDLYATKEAGELLNGKYGISHDIVSRETVDGIHIVTVKAKTASGRETTDIGAIPVSGLKGAELANALMKTITKAKRRSTLSLCGLGDVLDVSELDTVEYRTCDEKGSVTPPQNNSGFGRGQYASPEQTQSYVEHMSRYLDKRNTEWLDWVQNTYGELPKETMNLANIWQCDNHLVKWAKETGRLDPASCDDTGVKNRQIGRYTAIIYHRSTEDRRALAKELERYLDTQANRRAEAIRAARGEPSEVVEATDDEVDQVMDEFAKKEREPGEEG